jgi:valyl-tRNA synthetase
VTEEIWQKMPIRPAVEQPSISVAPFPQPSDKESFREAEARIERILRIVAEIRSQRGVANLSPAVEITVQLLPAAELEAAKALTPDFSLIQKLARVSALTLVTKEPAAKDFLGVFKGDVALFIPRNELGNVEEEKTRKLKEYEEKSQALQRAIEKLQNPGFQKAPDAVRRGVEKTRDDLQSEVTALKQYLVEVGAISG